MDSVKLIKAQFTLNIIQMDLWIFTLENLDSYPLFIKEHFPMEWNTLESQEL
jgi:hypothetical protein